MALANLSRGQASVGAIGTRKAVPAVRRVACQAYKGDEEVSSSLHSM